MDNDPDTPLEDTASLRKDPVQPALLESRVVNALRHEGLIRGASRSASLSWPARVAASLLLFLSGAIAGHFALPDRFGAPQAAPSQPRYLLLLSGDVTPAPDGSTRAAEYGNWARSLGARGTAISGDELTSHAEIVTNQTGATFPDLTTAGGYFLIEASDDASAAALARTCPHLRYGGSIVLRRIK